MRILLTIVLLMAVAAPASGLDRKPRKKEKKKGPGLFGRLTKGIDTFGKTLFDDDDNESK